jgi:hypothetical protein
MHARELIDLAALVSLHGPALVHSDATIPAAGVEQYWISSKLRLDRWARSLKEFARGADAPAAGHRVSPVEMRGVLEEVLTGEILTRVWTAVLCAYDRSRGTDAAEPVARSVLIGHVEAKHRVLRLLTHQSGIEPAAVAELNRLRRRTERWTDLLVGRLAGIHDIAEFAVDPRRAKDFAEDTASRMTPGQLAWPLTLTSLRAAFREVLVAASPNGDLNARLAAGVLACFPPELFNSSGLFYSLWLMRLTSVAEDAQSMIEELLAH